MSQQAFQEPPEPNHSNQTTEDKYDHLRRNRLPGFKLLGIEIRESPDRLADSAVISSRAVLYLLLLFGSLSIFLRLLSAELGDWASRPEVLPLWLGIGLVTAVRRFMSGEGVLAVLQGLATPLVIPVVFLLDRLSHHEATRPLAVGASALMALALAEQVARHFHRWLTAHAGMEEQERDDLRARFGRRFVSGYVLNLALALMPFALVGRGVIPSDALIVLYPVLAVAWMYRPRTLPFTYGVSSLLKAIVSFLSWGRWDIPMGSGTPGVFQSPAGPILVRWLLFGATLAALSITLAPPLERSFAALAAGQHGALLAGVVRSVLYPIVVVVSVIGIACGRELGIVAEDLDWRIGDEDGTMCFRQITERLRRSPEEIVQEHLYLGKHYHLHYPVLLHNRLLWEHGYILGSSGSGKTSRGILPLATQLIDRGDCAVVIIDLKGTNFLFQALRKRAGKRFKFVTNVTGHASHVFNPLRQLYVAGASLNQICEIVLEALRLQHGTGYGRSYFSRLSRLWLSDIIHTHPNIKTFHELFEIFREEPPPGAAGADARKIRGECMELISVIQSLAMCDVLNWENVAGVNQDALRAVVHMPSVLKNSEVVYFNLPDSKESFTAREIANLAVFALYEAAREAYKKGKRVYLFIDEFQNIASRQFQRILREARGFNMHVILSHQSLGDLETEDAPGLAAIVQQNTQFKQYFSATEEELQDLLVRTAGFTTAIQHSFSIAGTEEVPIFETKRVVLYDGTKKSVRRKVGSYFSKVKKGERPALGETFSASEILVPRMNVNDILAYSSDPEASIVQFGRDSGYSAYGGHWFAIRSPFAMSLREKDELEAMPWPKQTSETIVCGIRSRLYRPFFRYQGKAQSSPPRASNMHRGKSHHARPQNPAASRNPAQRSPVAQPTPKQSASTATKTKQPFWQQKFQQFSKRHTKGGLV